jgi:hypothetical protein
MGLVKKEENIKRVLEPKRGFNCFLSGSLSLFFREVKNMEVGNRESACLLAICSLLVEFLE